MPRNGSGVYSLPPGSTFSPNTLIQSSVVNGINTDLATDANTPRPIVAGGTGATTAAGALTAFGISSFAQTILDDISGAAVFATIGAGLAGSTTGYAVMPNGFKVMWGSSIVNTTALGGGTIVFPTSFTSYRQVLVTNGDIAGIGPMTIGENIVSGQPINSYNFTAYTGTSPIASGTIRLSWHAIGI